MSVWPQLEPLLAQVQKPARYIGCEDGAQTPEHDPAKVAWLLAYPDTYEIGLPNQGLQILYEILNERARRRRRAGLRPVDRPRGRSCGPHDLPLFSVDTHRAGRATSTCSAFNLSAELVYTNVLELHRPRRRARCGPPTGPATTCSSAPAATAPTTPSRSPTSSTSSCSATARRSSARSPRWSPRGSAADEPAGRRERRARATSPRSPASTCRRCTTCTYDGADLVGDRARASPTCPSGSRSAPSPTWPSGRTRKQPARAAHRGRPRPAQRRGVPRLHPGLPLLPGRHDHPPGAGAPGRAGAHDGERRPAPHRLRRGGAHVAVHRRLLRHRGRRRATPSSDPTVRPAEVSVSLPSPAGRRLHRRHRRRDPEGPPHRPHLRPRGRHLADAPGHQQADPRGGPLRRGRARPTRRAGGG